MRDTLEQMFVVLCSPLLILVTETSSVMSMLMLYIVVQPLPSAHALTLCPLFFFFTSIWLYLSQWEGQSREAGVRTAAGGGLPACRAGGAAGLLAGASENAGLPDATEGGSWDAADTPANRGPERVHTLVEEWPLRTSRPLWLSSSSVYLEFRLVTHVTVRITFKRKCKWFTLHYCAHASGSLSTPPAPLVCFGFLFDLKIWLAGNWSGTCDATNKKFLQCCGLWHYISTSSKKALDGLLSRDIVYTNNLCGTETVMVWEGYVCDKFCFSAKVASRSWKRSTLSCVGSWWQWRRT